MKKQFTYMEHETGNVKLCYWYIEELNKWHLYQDNYEGYIVATGKRCSSLRAFRRNLKNISRKQPELKGVEFRLVNKWYEYTKKGNKKSLDIIMKVR